MTMAALMHPHHTVDAFHRTTSSNCVSQELIHTLIGIISCTRLFRVEL